MSDIWPDGNYGVTPTGFVTKRLPDIIADMKADLIAQFGLIGDTVNVAQDSVFGRLISAIAQRRADAWQAMEADYYAKYPDSAEGYNLFEAGSVNGITPMEATHSTVQGIIWGTVGTEVGVGAPFLAAVEATAEQFMLTAPVTIQETNHDGAKYTVLEVVALGENYPWHINGGTTQVYTNEDPDATVDTIATAIAAQVNATSGIHGNGAVIATPVGAEVFFYPVDGITTFTCDAPGPTVFELTSVGTFGAFQAMNAGPVIALAGTLNQIVTPLTGVDSVTNLVDATAGRPAETEQQFRVRRLISLALAGAGTQPALRAHILEVPEVIGCTVETNRTGSTVGDLPAHTFRAIVQAPDIAAVNQAIGEMIWQYQPAGIGSYGTVTITVVDEEGNSQTVYFSRPTATAVWIKVVLTPNTEEIFPDGGLAAIAAAILAAGNALQVGEDVILGKFNTQVYSVPGIATATITRSLTGGSDYVGTNITIDSTHQATFDSGHITVEWAV